MELTYGEILLDIGIEGKHFTVSTKAVMREIKKEIESK